MKYYARGREKRVLTLPYLFLDAGFGVKYACRLAEAYTKAEKKVCG
jgi:hypothetical protein